MRFTFEYLTGGSQWPSSQGKFVALKNSETEAKIIAGQFMEHRGIPIGGIENRERIIAAGTFDKEGEIYDWYSEGFKVRTPVELQAPIQDIFRANKSKLASEKWAKGWLT